MAIRTRQELSYRPSSNPAYAKSDERDVIEFVNEEDEVVFFISVTKTKRIETVEGYLGPDPDIEGHTFEFTDVTVDYGVPGIAVQEWREVDPPE